MFNSIGREILDRFVFNAQTNFKFTIISSNGNPNSYKEEMAKADLVNALLYFLFFFIYKYNIFQ